MESGEGPQDSKGQILEHQVLGWKGLRVEGPGSRAWGSRG
jgi:hypothetical protein